MDESTPELQLSLHRPQESPHVPSTAISTSHKLLIIVLDITITTPLWSKTFSLLN
jgi:hypothetical protein